MVTSPQASLNPARRDDGGTVLCALELVASSDVELVEVGRTEVGQGVPLEPSPQELDRVQVRRVRRQERHLDGALGGVQVLANELAAMGLQTIPDDQQRPLQVGAQRLEELDVLFLLDRTLVQTEQAVRAAQPGDNGDVGPVEVELDDRRLPLGRPGAHSRRPLAQAGLVDEDDQSPVALGFFLSAGQVLRFHVCTASSSRSMARRSGFCTENPKPPRMRQICVWLNLTPYKRSMSTPTRLSVHSSVPKPCSVGRCSSARPSACSCSSSRRAGRPRVGIVRNASMPPSSSSAFHVYTVCRATPTACAACAGVLPANSMRPARKRRRTESSNHFVTMPRTQYLPSIGTTHGWLNGCHDLRKDQ